MSFIYLSDVPHIVRRDGFSVIHLYDIENCEVRDRDIVHEIRSIEGDSHVHILFATEDRLNRVKDKAVKGEINLDRVYLVGSAYPERKQ
ncbi:hypothetical protein HK104_004965, partial [Borealophlyctis nickersoniae]